MRSRLDINESFVVAGVRPSSFHHQGSLYYVETRARVIILNITAFQADRTLQRRSSSFMKHAVDCSTKSLGKEHSGLMSWPEHFYKPNKQTQTSAGPSGQVNSLSSRALQLSMFGSLVCQLQLFSLQIKCFDLHMHAKCLTKRIGKC